MTIIGITGQSGVGKGFLSAEFKKLGYFHADADEIYHRLLETNEDLKYELIRTFGEKIITDGKIDRKSLGRCVFGARNRRKLSKLNKITHRYVCREYVKLIMSLRRQNAKGLIIDAPLLIEARLHKLCDINIFVTCGKETQIERIIKRDNISREAAMLRINSQKSDSFYRSQCDLCFESDGELSAADFAKQINFTEKTEIG